MLQRGRRFALAVKSNIFDFTLKNAEIPIAQTLLSFHFLLEVIYLCSRIPNFCIRMNFRKFAALSKSHAHFASMRRVMILFLIGRDQILEGTSPFNIHIIVAKARRFLIFSG